MQELLTMSTKGFDLFLDRCLIFDGASFGYVSLCAIDFRLPRLRHLNHHLRYHPCNYMFHHRRCHTGCCLAKGRLHDIHA